eukprot:15089989-Ditylum_brightwellii.AAC.1
MSTMTYISLSIPWKHPLKPDKPLNILVQTAAFNPILKHKGLKSYEDCMYYPFGSWGRAFTQL